MNTQTARRADETAKQWRDRVNGSEFDPASEFSPAPSVPERHAPARDEVAA